MPEISLNLERQWVIQCQLDKGSSEVRVGRGIPDKGVDFGKKH